MVGGGLRRAITASDPDPSVNLQQTAMAATYAAREQRTTDTLFVPNPVFRAALSASLAILAFAANASAEPGGGTGSGATTNVPVAAPPDASPAPPVEAAPYVQPLLTTTPIVGPIEHLGADAYPNDPVRGIYGGSLWSIFHGRQWPYMPKTGVGVSGYVWVGHPVSATKPSIREGNLQGNASLRDYVQQGRFLCESPPRGDRRGKWFAQGQGEFVADRDQEQPAPTVANVERYVGQVERWNSFDLQFGRFEAWEVYHFGMGSTSATAQASGRAGLLPQPARTGPVPI